MDDAGATKLHVMINLIFIIVLEEIQENKNTNKDVNMPKAT